MPILQGGFSLESFGSTRQISVETQTALNIFDDVVISQRDQFARSLGLYGDVALGRNLDARFASLGQPKHLLSNRKNGCTWNPKGGIRMGVETFGTCPVEYDGEQCPDAFYNTCFESLFGTGNKKRDFSGSPESQRMLALMLRKIFAGLGESFFDLYNFANHPLISAANAASFFRVPVKEWEEYVDQMLSGDCAGLITQLDILATSGLFPWLNLDISETEINEITGEYTGNFRALVQSIIAAAPAELQSMAQTGMVMGNGAVRYPIILATPYEFDNYKNFITAMAGTNELAYRYLIEGTDGVTKLERNVLMLDNMPVIRWDAHANFDAVTGTQSHRVAVVAPGNFGVLHDVDELNQYGGMGLMVEQSKRLVDKGKVFFSTTFRWGAGIADTRLVAMASNILHPGI